MTSELFRVA